jgi:hypothetical protein
MFDTIYQGRTHTEYIPYEKTVKEIRAPTDDSIKLYGEIKEKAYKSILDSFYLEDNIFKASIMVYQDIMSDERVCMYKYTLNGIEYQDEFRSRNFKIENKSDIIHNVIKGISDQIAITLTQKMYANI